MKKTLCSLLGLSLALLIVQPAAAIDDKYYGNRIIVKFKSEGGKAQIMSADNLASLTATAGQSLHYHRNTGDNAQVLKTFGDTSPANLERIAHELAQRSDVVYAEVDYKRYIAAFPATPPNDTLYATDQWYLQDNSLVGQEGASNTNSAWGKGLTGTGVTIAVVDTGITSHQDLGNNIINGYDFISQDSPGVAETDGDSNPGRDSDATDSGDLVTQNDKDNIPVFTNDNSCSASPDGKSSWHGTMVAGVIGACTRC